MNTGKHLSRRSTLRGAMLIALTAIPSLFTKESADAAESKIVKLSKLPVGGTFTFITKAQGVPAMVFRTKKGVFAYSLICTHLGSTVGYNKEAKILACPSHGARFDPAQGGKSVGGQTKTPLATIKVAIKSGWVIEA